MQLKPPAMQARLAGAQPRTWRSSARAPRSHSKTQMQLTMTLLPYLPGPLIATERNPRSTSMSLCIAQISEETLVPSNVIKQLMLQLMPAIVAATFSVQCRPQLTFQRNLAIYGYEIATIQDPSKKLHLFPSLREDIGVYCSWLVRDLEPTRCVLSDSVDCWDDVICRIVPL